MERDENLLVCEDEVVQGWPMVSLRGVGLRSGGTTGAVCRPPNPWGRAVEGLMGEEQPLKETEVQDQAR